MRMYSSDGTDPGGNNIGSQTFGSLINKAGGDDYTYYVSFNAPPTATTMYYQFGDARYALFEDPAGNSAPFLSPCRTPTSDHHDSL